HANTNPLPYTTLFRSHSRPEQQEDSILASRVEKIVGETEIFDIHTHLYDPAFGELLLWGIDDLLNYHYLIAESFRYFDFPYEKRSEEHTSELQSPDHL